MCVKLTVKLDVCKTFEEKINWNKDYTANVFKHFIYAFLFSFLASFIIVFLLFGIKFLTHSKIQIEMKD